MSGGIALALALAGCTHPSADPGPLLVIANPTHEVQLETSLGPIRVALAGEEAPVTVENFLSYVNAGFYDGQDGRGATVFHRVIEDFVAQGGGFTAAGVEKDTASPIVLETGVGLDNLRGSIAMARTAEPDSATSQFFFNAVRNESLDYLDQGSPGYAVFGAIVEGLDTLEAIESVPVDDQAEPEESVIIESCLQL